MMRKEPAQPQSPQDDQGAADSPQETNQNADDLKEGISGATEKDSGTASEEKNQTAPRKFVFSLLCTISPKIVAASQVIYCAWSMFKFDFTCKFWTVLCPLFYINIYELRYVLVMIRITVIDMLF